MYQIKFECRLTKRPKQIVIENGQYPNNLEGMLKMIRKMGLKPSDVAVGELTFEYESPLGGYRHEQQLF